MRLNVHALGERYQRGERLTMVTAYDYTSARIIDRTQIPLVLVGDSLGMVMQGLDSTLPVTLDDIVYHTRAVMRGSSRPLIVADLPFLTYSTPEDALRNAGRLMAQTGCGSVKLEGGQPFAPTVRRLVEAGIPVMGHLGFTPQSVHQIGMRVQGKSAEAGAQLVRDAQALAEAGAWAIVLELVPAPLARLVTQRVDVPTIGIGAGPDCDGEVQVWHDVLGLFDDFVPRHTRRYGDLGEAAVAALNSYDADVRARAFPSAANSASLDEQTLAQIQSRLDASLPSGPGGAADSPGRRAPRDAS